MKSGDMLSLRLVDFGFSAFMEKDKKLTQTCGTTLYMSPELIDGSYDEKNDIWGAGTIMYFMLTGMPPFNDKDESKIPQMIKKVPVN